MSLSRLGWCALLAVVCLAPLSAGAVSGDWPGWRGPDRTDISTETNLLEVWPDGGPKKVWTSSHAGLGYSGLAIVDNVIYTVGGDHGDAIGEYLIALSAETGEPIWKTRVGDFLENGWGGGPRSTPTVAGDRVVVLGGQGDLVCMNRADGKEVWRASMKDLGGSVPNWGYTESPLVDGERVLATPGGSDGTVACFELADGKLLWQSTDVTEKAHYSSIIAVDHYGQRQYIQFTEKKVFGLDSDGKLKWDAEWPNGRTAVIPTPIYSEGRVYVTSGYGAGCMLLKIGEDNSVEKIYDNTDMKNHHGGVVLLDGHIYGHSDDVGMVCQDLNSGEVVWSDDKKQRSKGSITYADGFLYLLEERSGDCVLIRATPEKYEEVSRFRLDPQTKQRSDRGMIWTHPTICNGRLYLRDQEIICCYDISK